MPALKRQSCRTQHQLAGGAAPSAAFPPERRHVPPVSDLGSGGGVASISGVGARVAVGNEGVRDGGAGARSNRAIPHNTTTPTLTPTRN